MDPDRTWQDLCRWLPDGENVGQGAPDLTEVREALDDLAGWIKMGGFHPEGFASDLLDRMFSLVELMSGEDGEDAGA